jgi:hypothetical protein
VGVLAACAEGRALAAPAGTAPPLLIANPMSGSAAAAPSHNLRPIFVPSSATSWLPVLRPWRNSTGPEPPDVNEALPRSGLISIKMTTILVY